MKRFSIAGCVALAIVSGACSQGPSDARIERVGASAQAVTAPKPSDEAEKNQLFCSDCFEETNNGGGPGTAGSTGFGGAPQVDPSGPQKDDVDVVHVKGTKWRVPNPGKPEDGKGERSGEPWYGKGPGGGDYEVVQCPLDGEGKCYDWLQMCLAAAESDKAWDMFVELVRTESSIAAIRLAVAGLRSRQFRINMCYAVFGT